MTTNEDQPSAVLGVVEYLRLLPPQRSFGGDFSTGLTLFFSEAGTENIFVLAIAKVDALRLVEDIRDHYDGLIDIANPGDNYGR
jgi:hypothetical protein